MVRFSVASLAVIVSLGCAGMSPEASQEFENSFRTSFIESCAPAGTPSEQQRLCTCVANKVVKTKTPAELTAMLADPEEAVRPFVEICSRKMERGR